MAESKSKSKPKTKSKPQQKQKQKQSQIINVNINTEKSKSKPKKKSKSKPEQSLKGYNFRMSSQKGYRYIVQNQPSILQQMSIPNNNELMSTIQEILNRKNQPVPFVGIEGTSQRVNDNLRQINADILEENQNLSDWSKSLLETKPDNRELEDSVFLQEQEAKKKQADKLATIKDNERFAKQSPDFKKVLRTKNNPPNFGFITPRLPLTTASRFSNQDTIKEEARLLFSLPSEDLEAGSLYLPQDKNYLKSTLSSEQKQKGGVNLFEQLTSAAETKKPRITVAETYKPRRDLRELNQLLKDQKIETRKPRKNG